MSWKLVQYVTVLVANGLLIPLYLYPVYVWLYNKRLTSPNQLMITTSGVAKKRMPSLEADHPLLIKQRLNVYTIIILAFGLKIWVVNYQYTWTLIVPAVCLYLAFVLLLRGVSRYAKQQGIPQADIPTFYHLSLFIRFSIGLFIALLIATLLVK